ncbi:hypothetical protein K8I61_20665 [bacterium]|nr:hypothetical protein [bacterium]
MRRTNRIIARVSESTRRRLDKYVRATGVRKSHVVEQALLHYLLALEELPGDAICQKRMVLTRESFETVVECMATATPTPALLDLMREHDQLGDRRFSGSGSGKGKGG